MSAILQSARRRSSALWLPLARAWDGFRPEMSQEMLAVLVGLFLTTSANVALFRSVYATGALHGLAGLGTGACLFVLVWALNMLLALLLFNNWSVRAVLALLLPASAAAAYFMDHYGVYFDTDMVRNVLQTDARESSELVSMGLLGRVLLAGILPAALAWRVRLVRRKPGRAMLLRAGAIVLALVAVLGSALVSFQSLSALMRNHREIRHLITPGNYLASLVRVAADDGAARNRPRTTLGAGAHVAGKSPGQRPRLLVLVVGETVRAQNWGLNGYARQTTPQLARMDLVNFTDVSSCGTATEVSLPCMFSRYTREAYSKDKVRNSESVLHVLGHAGIGVSWLDNQGGCKGVCTGLDVQSFEHADDPEFCNAEGCLDGILLKALSAKVDQLGEGDAVIVLHQLGNHGPAYYRRHPPEFARFLPECRSSELGQCSREQVVNAYDNATLYTDDLLARAIRLLAAQVQRDTALVYLSDHGESLGEGGLYLHGMPYAIAPEEQKKVPMVMWLSPGFSGSGGINLACLKDKAGRQAVSQDSLFHTLLGLMQVTAPEYDTSLDLLDGCLSGHGSS
ncbi:phosphoethanolamine transferase [Pseudoxanthomonas koreensis]|uniref:phosphoethanolamine transferase n=1 Tax=Pseudoxanthomonas koreensis TaxID=266061 RepID=UPI001390C1B7|nr:phosphoethanolamine--lipid A transferase [Pseudoxanthomonas koreensis]KAF1690285.1 phosphoethanolamine transferase [Pseudoxanthomonas koreensis]